MATVFIPPLMRPLAGGQDRVSISGSSVRNLLDNLELAYPGMQSRLCQGGELKPGISVAVDGHVTSLGLHQKVREDSEVHFLPAVGGG